MTNIPDIFPSFRRFAIGALLILSPSLSWADTTLTISSALMDGTRNNHVLSIEEFERIAPLKTVTTQTPWHERSRFEGILGADLVERLGLQGDFVLATAINDYQVRIPLSDLVERGLLFATRLNGQPLTVRTKGPIFVIYPFDEQPELQTQLYYGRSIWQLKELKVE